MNDSTTGLTSSERVGSAVMSRVAPRRRYGRRSAAPAAARDRDRSRRPARPGRAAATVLVVGLVLLGAAAAEAQTERILVTNAFQTADDSANTSGNDHAQLFHTGGHTDGYILTSVLVNSDDVEDDDFDVEICGADTTANEFPTTDCTALTPPASFVGLGNVPFTHTGLALSANTNYVVVIKQRGTGSVELDSTTSSGEDSQGLSDWSIKNKFYWKSGSTWMIKSGSNEALTIIVYGYERAAVVMPPPVVTIGTEIWSATLTVGSRMVASVTFLGWNDSGNFTGASLTDQNFTFGGDTYDLDQISLEGGALTLIFDSANVGDIATQATRDKLTLYVGSDSFNLGAGTLAGNQRTITWTGTSLSWSASDSITLKITDDSTPAPPDVSSVELTSVPVNGFYAIGVRIEATVTFSAAVDITGTPQLELDFDGTQKPANCTAATNTTTMVCAYTVAVNDSAPNGITIAANTLTLNGGTITATGSTTLDADLDHGAVAIDANHKVDGIRPTLVTTGNDAPTTSTDGTQVILTFSENLGSVDRTKITIGIGGGNVAQTSAARVAGTKVELDLSTFIDATVMLTVALDLTAVEDGAGNDNLAVAATPVTNAITANASPAFSAATATRSVPENTAANTNIGTALPAATDADNDPLTYTLEGADATSFGFDAATRQLSTKSGVTYDRETQSSYSVTLKADDGNGGSDTIAVTITLTNVIEPPGRPAAPSVSSVAGSTTSLSVSWTAPSNTGPAIDNYDLEYRQGTSGSWNNGPQDVSGTSTTISGLTANTLYEVQVLATNAEGNSPWSPSGSGQTNTAGNTAPMFSSSTFTRSVAENSPAGTDVGNAVTATDADNNTLTYTLEGDGAASFAIIGASGQIRTRSGVTYDYEAQPSYTVMVKADDGNGGTDTVTVTIDLTNVDEPPRAPAAPTVTATPNTTDSLTVRWRAPSNTGRPAIDSYDLQYREGTSGSWTNGPQNVSGTSATIAGLTADPTAYQVQVLATNADGDSPWSPPGRIRTTPPPPPVGPPSPPRNLTAMAGDQAVQLSWSRPVEDGGARIVRYEYRQQEGDGPYGAWQIIWEDPPPTDHRVTELMNGTSYTFQVRAVNNGGGASPPSEPASATPEPELEPFEVAIVGVPDVAVAGESYALTAQSDAEESLVYAWRVAYGGSIEPDDAQMVVWTAPETAVVAWIRVDATREDGATAGQSAYVRVELPDPDDPEPVPALPLLGQLLLALGLTGAGARLLSRRPRVPPAA